jgi:nucleoid-associated protein YgaU
MLERRGYLRQALEERVIALTIDSSNGAAQAARLRLEAEIEREVSALTDSGRELLARGLHAEARRRLLAALALDPTNRMAFETLQNQVQEVTFLVHTVRRGETLASLADLYYGDRSRAEVIAETNRLALNARLAAGQPLRIPEIPGVPFLPH